MAKTKSSLELWLDSLVKDSEVINCYKRYNSRLAQRKTVSDDFNFYYLPDDSDIKSNDESWLELLNSGIPEDPEIKELKTYVEHYDKKKILIKPNINRFHCNYLFKQLVDYCLVHKLTYPFDNTSNKLLVEPDLKTEFYKFCKKYS